MKYTLKQLEVFAAVAEKKSFTAAAEALDMNQSTISIHVASLEAALETPLFTRSNKKNVALTAEGRMAYSYAKEILAQCEQLENRFRGAAENKLLIGASSIPSQFLLPRIMAGFINQKSSCEFVLKKGDSAEVHAMLRSREVRIGFAGTRLDDEHMDYYPLEKDELTIITPASEYYSGLMNEGKTGDDLLGEPMILREKGSGSRREFEAYLASIGFRAADLNVIAEVEQPDSILEFVSQGAGVSAVSDLAARAEAEKGRILCFPFRKRMSRDIYLVTRKDFEPAGLEKSFTEFVKASAK